MPFAKVAKKKSVIMALTILLVVSGVVGYFVFNKDVQEAAAWFNDDWNYRQAVPITNSGSALTDYQVSFTLDTSSLITAGKMQADCDDLRVADAQGQVLPYWIENSSCNTTTTKIWTKLSSIPVTTFNVYVYYGNTQATSIAKGSDVFVRIEDFESYADLTAVQNAGWKNYDGSTLALVTDGNSKVLKATDTGGSTWDVNAYQQFDSPINLNNYILEARWKTDVSAGGPIFLWQDTSNWCGSEYTYMYVRGNNCNSATGAASVLSTGTWYNLKFEIRRSAGGMKEWYNNTLYYDVPDGTYSFGTFNGWGVVNHNGYGPGYLDFMFVRQYAATEPTIGSLGSEEKGGGPIAYWKFDEGQGTTAYDSTTNSLNGTITSATWQTSDQCVSGNCLFFRGQGNDDKVDVRQEGSTSPKLTFSDSDQWTISAWLYDIDSINSYDFWIGRNSTTPGLLTRVSGSNYISFRDKNGTYHTLLSNNSIYKGKWTYHSYVADGAGNLSLYLNGQFITSTVTPTAFYIDFLGRGYNPSTYNFNGKLDDIKIYNYARSANQVLTDYNSAKSGAGSSQGANAVLGAKSQKWMSDGLVGYWKMDETSWTNDCSTATVIDSSGNSNNGKSCPASTGPTTPTAGKFGNAGSFDGTDDYIDTGINYTTYSKGIALAGWVKVSGNSKYLVANGGGSSAGYGVDMYLSGSGTLSVYGAKGTSGTGNFIVTGTKTINDNNWHYLLVEWDGTTNTNGVNIYVDGLLDASGTALATISSSSSSYKIAAHSSGSYPSAVVLDDLRIYSRTLSGSEVSDLYNWAPGTVGYWKLDDNTGTTAVDSSGNGNNGSITSATWGVGKMGSDLNFNGSSSVVTINDTAVIEPTGGMTAAAWFKTTNKSVASRIISKTEGGAYQLSLNENSACAANTLCFMVYVAGVGYKSATYPTSSLNNNQWYYASGTYDGATIKLYLNGVQVGSYTQAGTISQTNTPLCIGGESTTGSCTGGTYFPGSIDEVKIYNYARTPKQIMEDMNTGIGKAMAYWPLAKNTEVGGLAGDIIGSNNGTITGLTYTSNKFGLSNAAMSFGANKYINCGTNTALAFGSNAHSFTAWVKPTTLTNSYNYIISVGNNATGEQSGFGITNSGYLFHSAYSSPLVTFGGSVINIGNWYHVALVFENGVSRAYINGKYIGSQSITMNVTTGKCYIGAHTGASSFFDSASISDVKIYNYALLDFDVMSDYNQSSAINLGTGSESGDTGNAPVAWWKLDDNTGTTAVDSSGGDYAGSFVNTPTWGVGQKGSSISFNGSNNYINLPSLPTLTAPYTVSFWFYPRALNSTQSMLSLRGSNSFPVFNLHSNNKLLIYAGGEKYRYGGKVFSASDLNKWWHAEFVVADSASLTNWKVYLNGYDDSSTTGANTGGYYDPSAPSSIGSAGAGSYFNGMIDDVKIYNYARTQAQVAYDYNRGKPIGYWSLDEGTGNVARDFSSNGNNGTITVGGSGTQTTTTQAWSNGASGKYGKSLNFDGADDYIDIGNSNSLQITGDITIAAWVKTNLSGSYQVVVDDLGSSPYTSWCQWIDSTGHIVWYDSSWRASSTTINDGQWHHIATVVSNNVVNFYIDGKQDANSYSVSARTATSDSKRIGARADGTSYDFNGQLDDVRIYNYALDANQIKQAMLEGAAVRF